MWKVLLVEDQAIVRQGLKAILKQDANISAIHEATNGVEAIEKMNEHIIDLIMMDIRMPFMNGIEATIKIKEKWPNVKILILTTFNDEDYAMQALQKGANGFLLKTSDAKKLTESVHSCMNGGLLMDADVAAKIVPRLLKRKPESVESLVELTPREQAILQLIGAGMTNREISDELFLSVGTIKNHITQILQKTNLRDRTQLALYAVKHGMIE
ncbi:MULTISPECIES: response regulator transcription factor [unclassified Virgibacillus]|uniref:response regulator transcription factor n=1 Tax=unclassified Virgibacillus TaxID=2620237 RepID=UPI0024DED273|nr:response regulator transcription factor [Virgibacillus sp. LDC-1]